MCSSLLTDEYQLHKMKGFIPMMKFFQSTQLILKLQLEVADKTVTSSQFLESVKSPKETLIKETKYFICLSFGSSFDKSVHSFLTCSCEGSQCTSVIYPNRDKSFTGSKLKRLVPPYIHHRLDQL